MADRKEKIVYKDPASLIPYEYNAREHGTEIEFLKNSIQEFGFRNPILVDANDVIIAGHGRRMAAMDLGIEKVPCIICGDLTDEQVRALRVVDNRSSDMSSISWDNLELELSALKELGWDMQNFGFEDMTQFDAPAQEEEPEDIVTENIDVREPTKSYRLMVFCADEDEQNIILDMLSEKGVRCQVID